MVPLLYLLERLLEPIDIFLGHERIQLCLNGREQLVHLVESNFLFILFGLLFLWSLEYLFFLKKYT